MRRSDDELSEVIRSGMSCVVCIPNLVWMKNFELQFHFFMQDRTASQSVDRA